MKLKLAKSSTELTNRVILDIFGPRGAGKTWLAFTLSEKWPKDPLKNKRPVVLDDVLYWQWDPDGMIGLAPHKIRVKYVFNMPALIAEMGFMAAMREALAEANEIIAGDPKVKVEIHDTVTTMDLYSIADLEAIEGLAENTRKLFGMHKATHREYQTGTVLRPERVSSVYLFHEKVVDVEQTQKDAKATKAQKKKMRQKVMEDGKVDLVPETTGSGDSFYANACSMEMSVSSTPKLGETGKFTRELWPIVHAGRRTKNRFQHLFTGAMPPDLDLVRKKILDACK